MRQWITREEAVNEVGEELVSKAEADNCQPTCSVTSGTKLDGWEVYAGQADDGTHRVYAYYLVSTDDAYNTPLEDIDWTIEGYEIEEI